MRLFSLHFNNVQPFSLLHLFGSFSLSVQRSAAQPPGPPGPLPSSIYLQADSWTESAALATFPLLLFPSLQFLKGKRKGWPEFFFIIKRFHHSHVCKRSPSPAISIQPPPDLPIEFHISAAQRLLPLRKLQLLLPQQKELTDLSPNRLKELRMATTEQNRTEVQFVSYLGPIIASP